MYVICPVKITSPAPDYGLPPNAPCGCRVPVVPVADVLDCMCPRGHQFFARLRDVKTDDEGDERFARQLADVEAIAAERAAGRAPATAAELVDEIDAIDQEMTDLGWRRTSD